MVKIRENLIFAYSAIPLFRILLTPQNDPFSIKRFHCFTPVIDCKYVKHVS